MQLPQQVQKTSLFHSSVQEPFDSLSDKIVSQFIEPSQLAPDGSDNNLAPPNVFFDEKRGIILRYLIGPSAGTELVLDPYTLRMASRDALSVDEMTGEQILQPDHVPGDIIPLNLRIQGNYGVAIEWSDGHKAAIYSYEMMEDLAKKK